jgi:hypothetical protein
MLPQYLIVAELDPMFVTSAVISMMTGMLRGSGPQSSVGSLVVKKRPEPAKLIGPRRDGPRRRWRRRRGPLDRAQWERTDVRRGPYQAGSQRTPLYCLATRESPRFVGHAYPLTEANTLTVDPRNISHRESYAWRISMTIPPTALLLMSA